MKNNIFKNKKTIYLLAGGLVTVGVAGYFLLGESSQKKAENKNGNTIPEVNLENGIKVNADLNTPHGKELQDWVKNKKEERLALVTNLLREFKAQKNNEKVVNLITKNLKDDEYMKVFKVTFHYHLFVDKGWFRDTEHKWDLKSWVENRLSKEQIFTLKNRYPSLNTNLNQ